ncbi:hypothetical protein L6452_01517 [Arctium lappa]|uniref:Uncharacterized protein n=1 Tax=Arctium lappa TaxID=4217 RepID=A0ACB9FHR7_ARCLA|nr:hypothetical protein L6452_01517 [Arctium lappa]
MLRSNEFDMWKIRTKQYILLTDYSMWDIIENGPSDEAKIGADGKRIRPKTDVERKTRQTEMKALSTLLLSIPNEYQHQFCNFTDAQMLWNALDKRFSGAKSTKRNQKAILKQQYENFMSTKNESMTQTFDSGVLLGNALFKVPRSIGSIGVEKVGFLEFGGTRATMPAIVPEGTIAWHNRQSWGTHGTILVIVPAIVPWHNCLAQ